LKSPAEAARLEMKINEHEKIGVKFFARESALKDFIIHPCTEKQTQETNLRIERKGVATCINSKE